MPLHALVVVASLITLPSAPPASRLGIFEDIETRWETGRIDAETRHLWRVAAVKRPDLLPADLRQRLVSGTPPARTSLSRVFIEAFQWVARQDAWDGPVHALLQPPADLEYSIDSSTWPIRVTYRDQWDVNMAQQALAAAEHSFSVQIDQYGFYEPPTNDASNLYRIFIDQTGMGGGGYTAPFEYNNDTPWTDCYTYIVVDPSNGEWGVEGVVAHEANHAMQAAMDCAEVTTFWENTAVYIAAAVYPSEWWYAVGTMPYFQEQPWRALDFMQRPRSDLYEYGGGLFTIWLADTFSDSLDDPVAAGPRLLRAIWEASMQDSGYNEPDYYDAIEEVLRDRGFAVTMRDVLADFSEARFFVGSRDDNQHITDADEFQGAEVTVAAHYGFSALPIYDAGPSEGMRPAPFGANHIQLELPSQWDRPLRVDFDGDDETEWAVRLVRFGSGATLSEQMVLSEGTWDGSMVIQPGGFTDVLMVVNNLGSPTYDPDARSWPTADYRYDIRIVSPPPTLDRLDPDTIEPGTQNATMTLQGAGFLAGPEFFLRFDDPSIQVVSVDHVSATQVVFTITVPRLTELGPKTVVLTNGDGTVARGEGFLEVAAPGGTEDDDPADGCSCRSGDGGGGLGLLLGLALLGWLRRRRC